MADDSTIGSNQAANAPVPEPAGDETVRMSPVDMARASADAPAAAGVPDPAEQAGAADRTQVLTSPAADTAGQAARPETHAAQPVQPTSSIPEDDIERMAMQLAGEQPERRQAREAVATMVIPTVRHEEPDGPKPVVIKGGPRRVVRADGLAPETGQAVGQRRFRLSSGHEMFQRQRRISRTTASIIGIACILLAAAVVVGVWRFSNYSATLHEQRSFVDTTLYDGSLSVTPAADGGYYTVVFVTSTPTNEQQIGDLSQIVMYRTAERPDSSSFSQVIQVNVPVNLAVSVTSSDGTSSTAPISDVLSSTGITRALTGIDSAFGLRVYNVIVTSSDYYGDLERLLTGQQQASDYDAGGLLGHVRSNLSTQGIVDYASKVGAAVGTGIVSFDAPTTAVTTTSGQSLVTGSSTEYLAALNSVLAGGSAVVATEPAATAQVELDEQGNPVGTQYDEAGNPILDQAAQEQAGVVDQTGQAADAGTVAAA